MIARTTPATMIPILAPDVILTLESFKRSGRVSMANGWGQDKLDQEKGESIERSRTVNEPEECTSSKTASKEGQEGGNENGGPNGNTATEISAVAHRVIVENSLVC